MNVEGAIKRGEAILSAFQDQAIALENKHANQALPQEVWDQYYAHIEDLKKDIETLEILLESAKLFHLHTVPEVMTKFRAYVQLPEETDRKYTHMFGVPLEKLGIEVD